jgi:hypothetical protein
MTERLSSSTQQRSLNHAICAPQVRLMRDKDTGVGKGFAFVRYNDPESATVSCSMLFIVRVS